MPNAENAILDPFSAMAPTEAIMVAVCGLVVVFLMLAILALVIRINSKLVSLLEGRKEEPAPAPVTKHAPAAPAPAPAAPAVDEGELVAVMMAAIAEESGMSPNSFRITNVSAAPAAAPVGGRHCQGHRRVHRRHRQHRRPAGDSGVKALSSPRERHCERQNSLSGYIRLCR